MMLTTKQYNKVRQDATRYIMRRYGMVDQDLMVTATHETYPAEKIAKDGIEKWYGWWVKAAGTRYIHRYSTLLRSKESRTTTKMCDMPQPEGMETEFVDTVVKEQPPVFARIELLDIILELPQLEQAIVMSILTNAMQLSSGTSQYIRRVAREWICHHFGLSTRMYKKTTRAIIAALN